MRKPSYKLLVAEAVSGPVTTWLYELGWDCCFPPCSFIDLALNSVDAWGTSWCLTRVVLTAYLNPRYDIQCQMLTITTNFSMDQNHLEGLLKYRLLIPLPGLLIQAWGGWGLRICIYKKFQVMPMFWDPTLRTTEIGYVRKGDLWK